MSDDEQDLSVNSLVCRKEGGDSDDKDEGVRESKFETQEAAKVDKHSKGVT